MLNWKIKPGYKNIEEKTGKNKVVYLSFSAFEKLDFVKHAFSTRLGGVSEANQSTMNLSFTKEPLNKNNVLENFSRMAEVLEVKIDDFVFTHQTHTTNIRRAGLRDRGKGITAALDYSDIDGLIRVWVVGRSADSSVWITMPSTRTPFLSVSGMKRERS